MNKRLPCRSFFFVKFHAYTDSFPFPFETGLKRTGKSCRLRWLNYLNPDVKRGNLTPEEQLLILDLHSKWGNRCLSCAFDS